MNNSTSLQDQKTKSQNKQEEEEEEEEDALSLCDLALNSGEPERNNDSLKTHHRRRSSSQPPDSFEFSNDLNSDNNNMSHAEDIIHSGKLIPYKQQQQQQQSLLHDQILLLSEVYDSSNFSRRYCDSLPARSNSYAGTRLTRSSRSLDRKKLRRNSSLVMKSEASDIHRSLSKGMAKPEATKPRWYDLMFGSVKLPPEMDLRDMKNRQVRRNPCTMFPAVDARDGTPASRSDRASSWGHDLLRVLSCKNHPSSVAVTASIGLVPQL